MVGREGLCLHSSLTGLRCCAPLLGEDPEVKGGLRSGRRSGVPVGILGLTLPQSFCPGPLNRHAYYRSSSPVPPPPQGEAITGYRQRIHQGAKDDVLRKLLYMLPGGVGGGKCPRAVWGQTFGKYLVMVMLGAECSVS